MIKQKLKQRSAIALNIATQAAGLFASFSVNKNSLKADI
jgi:hypothetical protein